MAKQCYWSNKTACLSAQSLGLTRMDTIRSTDQFLGCLYILWCGGWQSPLQEMFGEVVVWVYLLSLQSSGSGATHYRLGDVYGFVQQCKCRGYLYTKIVSSPCPFTRPVRRGIFQGFTRSPQGIMHLQWTALLGQWGVRLDGNLIQSSQEFLTGM